MKKIKQIFITLVILIALMFTGMKNASAQVDVRVWWYASCPDTCTTTQVCAYYVEYAMYYICDHDPELICSGNDTINCAYDEVVFPCNYSCEDHTSAECYLISATATKYCIGPPNGYLVKCTGRGSETYTCDQIMQDQGQVQIIWDD